MGSLIVRCIEHQRNVKLQQNVGAFLGSFSEVLCMYLKSLFAIHAEEVHLKKKEVSIGLAVAPVLSNLYREIQRIKNEVIQIFRYMDVSQ